MKLSVAAFVAVLGSASAFQPTAFVRKTTSLQMGFDLSGNDWKPDAEKQGKMGSTDVGDYFPEGYDPNSVDFTEGMLGSQSGLNQDRSGPELPGMENLGEDAVLMGGIEASSEIPAGMEFIPSSVPDGEYTFNVAASSSGQTWNIEVGSPCMTFEDFFAAFTKESHPAFKVQPEVGRMDRRGGEPTIFAVSCTPNGQSGDLNGQLVINLPEDNSKITYNFNVKSF